MKYSGPTLARYVRPPFDATMSRAPRKLGHSRRTDFYAGPLLVAQEWADVDGRLEVARTCFEDTGGPPERVVFWSYVCECSHNRKDHADAGPPYDNWQCSRCACVDFLARPKLTHALTLTPAGAMNGRELFSGRCACSWSPERHSKEFLLAAFEAHEAKVRKKRQP